VGKDQQLIFREITDIESPVRDYDGHHICIYISNFHESFFKLQKKGLLLKESKYGNTFEDALKYNQLRFQDIIVPNTTDYNIIYRLQHEVRSLYHPLFMVPGITHRGDWLTLQ